MIKITDFGVSIFCDNAECTTLCGTYTYMSPEMFIGDNYNTKTDIWYFSAFKDGQYK